MISNRLGPSSQRPSVAVIGGSGLYSWHEDPYEIQVETPYGAPSAPITVGQIADRAVAFIPRHGKHHELPAHQVNYRANMWALRWLGVTQVLAPCAVGSLRAGLGRGAMVVPDQLVDRTTQRNQTFHDVGAAHVSFADPYCPVLRAAVLDAMCAHGEPTVDGATLVVIDGPRFSTRAESQWYAAQGWDLVNMTGHPEAVLARELAQCYTPIALVTDLDAGIAPGDGVAMADVLDVFAKHMGRLADLLRDVVAALPTQRMCKCPHSVDGFDVPIEIPG